MCDVPHNYSFEHKWISFYVFLIVYSILWFDLKKSHDPHIIMIWSVCQVLQIFQHYVEVKTCKHVGLNMFIKYE